MTIIEGAPSAILRREEELPFVDMGDGSLLQVLQVDLAQGIWVIRNRFVPGTTVQTHRHTGSVYAFT
ncbi:MAG: cupin, partial [Planctomycetia bacterium]